MIAEVLQGDVLLPTCLHCYTGEQRTCVCVCVAGRSAEDGRQGFKDSFLQMTRNVHCDLAL